MYAYWYGPKNTDVDGIIVEKDIRLITKSAAENPRFMLKLLIIRR